MSFANVPVAMLSDVDTKTVTGAAVFVGQIFAASFTSTFGDTAAVGVVKVQGSNETASRSNLATYIPSATSWNDIPSATSAISSGVGPAIVIPSLCFQYIRVIFTYTSGGTTTVVVNGNLFST